MGQPFTRAVEDLDPIQDVTYPEVLLRLAASVRATGFDIRALYRVVMNSQVYQRQFRQPESIDQHLHFGACCPTPIRPDELWSELTSILGPTNGDQFLGRKSTLNLVPPLSLKELFDQTFPDSTRPWRPTAAPPRVKDALLARRLIEAGVTFVEVNSGGLSLKTNWDTHTDNFEGHKRRAARGRRRASALIQDLKRAECSTGRW